MVYKFKDYCNYIQENYLIMSDREIGEKLKINKEFIKNYRYHLNLLKRPNKSRIGNLTKKQREALINLYDKYKYNELSKILDIDVKTIKLFYIRNQISHTKHKKKINMGFTRIEQFFINYNYNLLTPKQLSYILDRSEKDIINYRKLVVRMKDTSKYVSQEILDYITQNKNSNIRKMSRHLEITERIIRELLDDINPERKTNKKWTDDENKILKDMWETFKPIDEIYKQFGNRTEIAVFRHITRLTQNGYINSLRSPLKSQLTNREKDVILYKFYNENKTPEEISKLINKTLPTIRFFINEVECKDPSNHC